MRLAKAFLLVPGLGCLLFAQNSSTAAASNDSQANKAAAYYNFAMGRVYSERAQLEGNREYVAKAIQYYQDALKLDPSASVIFDELTDLYIQTGDLKGAVQLAQDLLKQEPDNLDAHRMLGRVYTRMIGNPDDGTISTEYVRLAIKEFQAVTAKNPKDADSWILMGRLESISHNSPQAEKDFNAAIQADPGNEDALTGLAMLYSDMGDSQKAIEKLKEITAKNPSEHTLMLLADQYKQVHDYKSAAEVLKKATQLAPDDGRLARELARDLLYSNQVDDALKLYQQLAADEPRDPEPPLRMAEIYRSKGDYPKAQEQLDKAKALDGENLEIRYEEVNLLQAEGKSAEAINTLKAMLDDTSRRSYSAAEASNRAMLLEKLGILERAAGKYPEAVDAFRQFGSLDPDDAPRAAVQVIDTYRVAKDYDSALKEADAALQKFPKERMIKLEHASVLADQGKIDAGAAELRKLLGGDHDRDTWMALAQLYEKGKRYKEMGEALDAAEKLNPSDDDKVTIYFMRGAMYERTKDYGASEDAFRKVLAIDPNNAEALNYLGYTMADRGVRLDEAYQLVKKALDQEPDNGAYLDSMGWVYFREGKLDEAQGLLTRALQRMDDPTVHDHLGDVYFKMGKTREAIAQWQASLKGFQSASTADSDPDELAKVGKKLDDARVKLAKEKK